MQIIFHQQRAKDYEILKNIMFSYVTANGKSLHTNLDNLNNYQSEYNNDAFIQSFNNSNSLNALTEFKNFL